MSGTASRSGHEKSQLVEQLEAAANERIAPAAKHVDKNSRFPHEALDVMKELRLLSSSLPTELGGLGLTLPELSEIASVIGRRCGASAMVFAMHESQIESVRFAAVDDSYFEEFLRDYAENQKLVASVTSEAGIGGSIRTSQTVAAASSNRIVFEKQSPTLSYGEYADGFLITARRDENSPQSDQVLVYASKEDTELEKLGSWDMMGMRGTCSPPFKLSVDTAAEAVLDVPFALINNYRMGPWSHTLWAAAWEGIASSAYGKAVIATRKRASKQIEAGDPLGDSRLADAYATLSALRALVASHARMFQDQANLAPDYKSIDAAEALVPDTMTLKIQASTMAQDVARLCLEIIGMPGYSEGASTSVSREVRDLMSGPLMISNDRLRRSSGEILMMGAEV